ncbi:uncharacterized protein Z518_09872 [Rhinocladiella mackenziei CBS 650.93]|uniref:DUF7514 domain-containing protein n=1 Tax=Rhinocladiella mackenziei CBS 650.93 TaxID=1442369 RepID=A0A0D2FFL2_9EURO|nr:uncharacterized protein Z518_09872 [Rhinocladiella mackenziei CBS 650.93]KIX00807.1 hypothetical protein Z518_09872 [Rhinocladiella mackenziei CBS 650.93]
MATNQSATPGFWRYLINPDKSASPQLETLCLGLAKIISTFEPGPPDGELTPQRLAAFYRAVGGNYDSLFLRTSDHALSFMYQTLGCFHSLQPTSSPFETPRIPCLTPTGFARWQTIQILLCPDENVGFMQKAVQRWNVLMPTGGTFPNYIPKEVFPDRPDAEMERWHKMVTGQLNQKNYNMRRIKNSPQSPHPEASDRRDGYFSNGQLGRPARPSRSSSRDDQVHVDLYRRRSSVPDFPSPSGERGSHWDPRNHHEARKTRSHSAQRPPLQPGRQRSHTSSGPPSGRSYKGPSNSPPSKQRRDGPSTDQYGKRLSAHNIHYRSPARTPSTVDEDTGSEASSETSQRDRRHRTSDEDRRSRRSSLWVPPFMRSHKRRHSSDASYRTPGGKPPQPLRPEYYPPRAINSPPQLQQPSHRGSGAPQYRDTVWDSDPVNSTPATPTLAQAQAQADPRAPTIRYPDQSNLEPLTRESSGSGTEQRHRSSDWERGGAQRRQGPGAPSRVATLTGVHGRKYPTADPLSPIERQRSHASSRGGVPAMV